MNRRFPGVFIPAEVWLDTDMSWVEKMYLAEIDSLENDEKGCFASNKYFGQFFNQSPQKAAAVIKQLESRNAIKLSYDEQSKRHIYVIHPAFRGDLYRDGVLEVMQAGGAKESQEQKDLRKVVREYFFKLYHFKAREMTGRTERADGKPFYPPWGGKEGKLLKSDFEQHGIQEMKRMMLLFFSDKVREVADFTRYTDKAGYSYTVFHGSIPKLMMAKAKPKEPCMECGRYTGHYPECSKYQEIRQEKEIEYKEIEDEKIDFSQTSLMDMIRNKQKTNRDSYLEESDEKTE